jgi:hypothetical protein
MSKAPRSASSPAKKPSGKSNAFLFTPDDFAASLSEPVDVSQFEENSDVLGLNPEKNIDEVFLKLNNAAHVGMTVMANIFVTPLLESM